MATQDISQLVVEVKSKGIQTAANQLDKLAIASDKAEVAVKKLGTTVVGVNGSLSGGVANATALVGAMTSLTAVLNRMATTSNAARTATRGHNEAMAEAHALARGLSGSLGALWVTYGNLAGMGVGIALGASLKGVVSVGKDVEQTLEQIRVLGEATTTEISKMRDAVTSLGKGVQGPKDVAEALSVLTLAGLNAKEALTGVGASLNLAVAGGVSVEKSAETLVQVGSALGYTASGFDHVADVIAKTAAASMSSVDSISNAFKSAAAVGEVYGASLNDIAVGLAAVANLGIQGTSAGTALKNFYKDLSASTTKVTTTLKDMHLTIADFRDAKGFMLPLVDVVKKLNDGMGTLTGSARNMAQVKLFSQQGVREWGALSSLINTAAKDTDHYKNRLEELQGEIKKAAAFATTAAIAMSQTTNNQLKSVSNTLQTVFIEAFRAVEPQIGEVARALKAAFNSPEFLSGLKSVITAIADLTKFVVENAKALVELVAVWWTGVKVLAAAQAATVALAGGFSLARVGALAFQTALGPIGIAIAALTAAWVLYKATQADALDNKAAQATASEYAEALIKAAEKEQQAKDMRLSGMSELEIARQKEIDNNREASAAAIRNAEKGVSAMKKVQADLFAAMNPAQQAKAGSMLSKGETGDWANTNSKINDYVSQVRATSKAELDLANTRKIINVATEKMISLRTENADAATKAAREALEKRPTGDGELSGKKNAALDNAKYNEAIQEQENAIKKAYQELKQYKEQTNNELRAGQIGELTAVQKVAYEESRTYELVAAAIENQINIARSGGEKRIADVTRFQGEYDLVADKGAETETSRVQRILVAKKQAEQDALKAQIQTLEDGGKFVEAANLKWSAENKNTYLSAQNDLRDLGSLFPWLASVVEDFSARQKAAINAAELKQAVTSFDTALIRVSNTLKGFKAANTGVSIGEMMDAATAATADYNSQLVKAQVEYAKLTKLAESGDVAAVKAAEEAKGKLLSESEKFRQMWSGVGDTIAKELEAAFGRGGKALGDLYNIKIKMDQNDKMSTEAKLNSYGDMAKAATGFFEKNSKGYKAMDAISKVFHVAAMARTLAQTAASVVAGAAQFFAQSGWAGFAGVAAMGAVLAGLGYAMSGASNAGGKSAEEVQKTQGTGGVFGDATAKSETLNKSMEILKTNSDLMLPLTQGMLISLKNIESSMVGLTNLVFRANGVTDGSNLGIKEGTISKSVGASMAAGAAAGSYFGIVGMVIGGIIGAVTSLWGKTKQSIVDAGIQFKGAVKDLQAGQGYSQYASVNTTKSSWFGLVKNTTNSVQTQGLSEELSKQFGLIFTNLEDVLKIAAVDLGSTSEEVAKAIDSMVIDTGVSLKGLSGKDLQDALNGVISKVMDDIAEKAFPAMGAFRQVGEGYAQTVIRVASGIEVANSELAKLGVTAIKYTDIANKTGDVTLEIVKQSIALKEGASGVGNIMKNIVGETKDLTAAYGELVAARKQMGDLGLGNGLNMDTLKGVGSIKNLTSDLSTYYDKFFTSAEKARIETNNMTQSFEAVGYTLPASRDVLRSWIEAAAAAGDQATVGKLLNLVGAFDKLVTSVGSVGSLLDSAMSAANVAFSNLKDSIAHAKDLEDKSYAASKKASDIHHKAIIKGIDADADAQIAAAKATEAARRAVMEGTMAGLVAQRAIIDANEKALNATVNGLQAIISTLEQAIEATKPKTESYARAMVKLNDAMTLASAGGDIGSMSGLGDAIKTVGANSSDSYSSAFEYQRAQAEANNLLNSLRASGETALTDAQRQLEALALQKQAIEDQTKALQEAISKLGDGEKEEIRSNAQKLKDAEDVRYQAEQDSMTERHQAIMDNLDETLRIASDQLDALKGLDTTLKSVAEALKAFNVAVATANGVKVGTAAAAASGTHAASNFGEEDWRKKGMAEINDLSAKYGGDAYYLKNDLNGYDAKQSLVFDAMKREGLSASDAWTKSTGHSEAYWRAAQDAFDKGDHPTVHGMANFAEDNSNAKALPEGYITTVERALGVLRSTDFSKVGTGASFDVGTNFVPNDMMAMVHKGERIIPAADNTALERRLESGSSSTANDDLKAVISELIDVVKIGDVANVQKTNEMFKTLRDWDNTGMPPTRTPTV